MSGVKVKVVFHARLRELVGLRELLLELTGSGFDHLADGLRRSLGCKARHIFDEDLTLQRSLLFSVNNRLIPPAELKSLRFKDGDVVDIMPPPSGG